MKTPYILVLTAAVGFVAVARAESPEVRSLSLQDCIQQALEHNLDLRIERYNPQVALFNVQGAYGAYDPTFSLSGEHDSSKSGQTLFQGAFTVPGQETETDTLNSSLGGQLPWGMQYGLSARSLTDTDGKRFFFDTNLLQSIAFPYSTSGGRVGLDVTQPLVKDLRLDTQLLLAHRGMAAGAGRGEVRHVSQRAAVVGLSRPG